MAKPKKDNKSNQPAAPTAKFFTLLYGNNKTKIFNSDTTTILLLDQIRNQCEADVTLHDAKESIFQHLDLATKEGNCLMLHENLRENASEKVEPRGEYLLVALENAEESEEGSSSSEPKRFRCLWAPPEPTEEGEEAIQVPEIVAGGGSGGKKKGKK